MNGAECVKIERFDSKPHEMFMDFFASLFTLPNDNSLHDATSLATNLRRIIYIYLYRTNAEHTLASRNMHAIMSNTRAMVVNALQMFE